MVDVGLHWVRARLEKLRVLVWGLFEVQGGSEAASRFPVSFLYDRLEQRDHSDCLFTSLTQVGNKQQSRHARISWTVEIFFFLAIATFHSLILCFISSLFPAKPLKGNAVQQINKWPDSPGRINTYCWGWLKPLDSPILTRHRCSEQNVLVAKTSQEL